MKNDSFAPARRRWLRLAAAAAGGMAAMHAGAADKPAVRFKKYSKERVGYRDEPYQGRSCAKCMLYAGDGDCAIVEGSVSQNGWCVQWTPATMGPAGPGTSAA
jgi:hypothetical protein